MHTFTKIALLKAADIEETVLPYLAGGETDVAEQLSDNKGLLGSTGDWLKEKWHGFKDALHKGGVKASEIIRDHPVEAAGALVASKAVGAAGAGLLGWRALKRSRSNTNRAIAGLETAADKINALKRANKKLGLLASIGIPGSVAATYFATKDSGKKKRK